MSFLIKLRHSLKFDRWANRYDRSILQWVVFNRSHNMFFREMAPFLKEGLKVLDIGCGTGRFAYRLSNLNKDLSIHGVDISKEMIRMAKSKLKDEKIEFKIGDVEELPYESGAFDIVTCSHSFHHYPNQKRAVGEMHRILKGDGKLMIIDGCRDIILGKVIFGVVRMVEKDVYHIFQRELKDMLLSVGFNKVMQKRFNPIPPLLFTLGIAKK